jgi:hypothetical protein
MRRRVVRESHNAIGVRDVARERPDVNDLTATAARRGELYVLAAPTRPVPGQIGEQDSRFVVAALLSSFVVIFLTSNLHMHKRTQRRLEQMREDLTGEEGN